MKKQTINNLLSEVNPSLVKEFWSKVDTSTPIRNISALYDIVCCMVDWSDSEVDYDIWDDLHMHLLSKVNSKLV